MKKSVFFFAKLFFYTLKREKILDDPSRYMPANKPETAGNFARWFFNFLYTFFSVSRRILGRFVYAKIVPGAFRHNRGMFLGSSNPYTNIDGSFYGCCMVRFNHYEGVEVGSMMGQNKKQRKPPSPLPLPNTEQWSWIRWSICVPIL